MKTSHSLYYQKHCTSKAKKFFELYPNRPIIFFITTKSHELPIAVRSFLRAEVMIQDLLTKEEESEGTGIMSRCFVYSKDLLYSRFTISPCFARQCISAARKQDHYKEYFALDPKHRFTTNGYFGTTEVILFPE